MGLEPVPAGAALILQQLVVEGEAADEHADVGAGQRRRRDIPPSSKASHVACSSSRCCGSRRLRLARRDPEELRVELVDLAEVPAAAGDHLAGLRRIRVVVSRGVPTCLGDVARGVGLARAAGSSSFPADPAPPGRRHPMPTIANGGCSASMFILSP